MRLSQPELINKPVVLVVAVHVLGSSQGVGDAFDRIDNGAGEIVSWIDIVLGAMARMGLNLSWKSQKCLPDASHIPRFSM